ncbi:MAG: nucleoside triphosphate pyrophosphohydrolase [Geitlerinemataceae cyanobacterium]
MSPFPPNPSTSSDAETLAALQQLIEVVVRLRSPQGGCPWDLAQTPQTLIPYVIEEAYEVVDALRKEDPKAIAEELGDLLLQVILQAQIARENHHFTLADVAGGIAEKLVRRHPHVFGDVKAETPEEVRQTWEQIKAAEKGETTQPNGVSAKLSRYKQTLPPLMAGMKISRKAAEIGFEWENIEGVWEKFREELGEFQYALEHESRERQEAELGDLLFAVINIARWQGLDPSSALQGTNDRFVDRFSLVEAWIQKTHPDRPLSDFSLEELEVLWQRAKALLAQNA